MTLPDQLLEAAAGVEEAFVPDELELSFELVEFADAVLSEPLAELSEPLDESLPDLASELPLADAGFAEE